ncbi:uncharacterized protein [Nicotiana tomentosiformis]|uniref:uncharacterized protein isoform X5 n=1 Tax=Nicotiana tomentosiformis TaxID=4098 RepID=UPI00388CBB5D
MQDTQRNEIRPCESGKAKKVRGTNRCKKVAGLKVGEKLSVTFYHNRVVGKNHVSFTRHLGILVRNRNMCPLRVHSWADIEEYKLQHMWKAVTDKFDSDDINDQRDHVLKYMRKLWNNWRGSLHKNIKSKSFRDALKDVPNGVDTSDWEWLVKEHFLLEKFKGGKDGNPPDVAIIFFETRKKDRRLVEPESNEKYEAGKGRLVTISRREHTWGQGDCEYVGYACVDIYFSLILLLLVLVFVTNYDSF